MYIISTRERERKRQREEQLHTQYTPTPLLPTHPHTVAGKRIARPALLKAPEENVLLGALLAVPHRVHTAVSARLRQKLRVRRVGSVSLSISHTLHTRTHTFHLVDQSGRAHCTHEPALSPEPRRAIGIGPGLERRQNFLGVISL